ncbi:MAG: asparaginase [Hyperthermus sp.]|nr:MAG: asparaginase [Hyperthermus sp.]
MDTVTIGPLYLGEEGIIVHGGVGGWRGIAKVNEVLDAVRKAVSQTNLNNPFTAVVEAVRLMEDSGVLNAGLGSTLSIDGRILMDAGVMSGGGRWETRAGAVAAVSYPRNPIRLAAWIAHNLSHILLVGIEADRLAAALGMEKHPGPTERALNMWRRLKEKKKIPSQLLELYGDTVGAAAVVGGETAAAASTGGLPLKHPGRIGDTPIPGSGFYALDNVGACSATGIGETILLSQACSRVINLMSRGLPVVEAVKEIVKRHTSDYGPNTIGIIAIDHKGYAAAATNAESMPIAYAGSSTAPTATILAPSSP